MREGERKETGRKEEGENGLGTVSVLSKKKEREFNLGVNGMKGTGEYGRYCTREVGNHEARVKAIDITVRKESGKNEGKRSKKDEDGEDEVCVLCRKGEQMRERNDRGRWESSHCKGVDRKGGNGARAGKDVKQTFIPYTLPFIP